MVTNGGIEDRALDLVLGDDVDQDLLVTMNFNAYDHRHLTFTLF